MAKKRIAVVCTGAVGGYAGAHMVKAGEDVTFIDFWPEHVEKMKKDGLTITHLKDVEPWTVPVRALHVTEAQQLSKEQPFDIAFVCTKSYDTAWATTMIKQYLAPDGYCVSLQNCMNEETIAGIVGWGKTLGSIASSITVEPERARPHRPRRRQARLAPHRLPRRRGARPRHRPRARRSARCSATPTAARSPKISGASAGRSWCTNVDGERGLGLHRADQRGQITDNEAIRHFQARLGSEAIRIGQALGYKLEEIGHQDPELIARAGEGDAAALKAYDEHRLAKRPRGRRRPAAVNGPGHGQGPPHRDRVPQRLCRAARARRSASTPAPTSASSTSSKRSRSGELKPDPQHISDLRLN